MVFAFLNTLVENILTLIKSLGYFGIFLGMAIESSFIPLPSEVILIPAGVLVARGEMNFLLILLLSVLGSLIGAWITYFLSFFLGRKTIDFLVKKYGQILFLSEEKLKKTDDYFKQHGQITIFIGRLTPVVRHLVSLPAGFSNMNFVTFSAFTALGAGLWTLVLLGIGYFFGGSTLPILKYVVGALIFVCVVIGIVYYLKKSKKNKK